LALCLLLSLGSGSVLRRPLGIAIRRRPTRVAAPAAVHGADRNPLSPDGDGLEAGAGDGAEDELVR